jgi:hypothetical protein
MVVAGYVGDWIPFMRAAHRVARIAHCRSDEACFALIRACLQGDVASWLGDTEETIPAGQWYGAGLVEGFGLGLPDGGGGTILDGERGPPSPRRSPNRPVELRREDVERLWPGGPASWRGELGREGWAEAHDLVLALEGLRPDGARELGSQRRLAYKGELASFMLRLRSISDLSDEDVARRFEDEVASKVQAGRSVLKLPQRRHVANQVASLRPKILARRQRNGH